MLNYDKINSFMNLEAIHNFCVEANNLHLKLNNVIHVAGTNGKGSTVAFLRSILEASGYTVNVFISPHLVRENERIRIKGHLITNHYNDELDKKLQQYQSSKKLSIFETFMAKALLAFTENSADYNILEVGLGGRLDATNIVRNKLVEVITPIDFDHEHILGDTLAKIASEKAGIIIEKSICISAYQDLAAHEVLQEFCAKKNTKFISGGTDWFIKDNQLYFKQQVYDLSDLSLLGEHQKYNAGLALTTLLALNIKNLTRSSINIGLKTAKWSARLQDVGFSLYGCKLSEADKIILDGAHNPSGINVLNNFILSKQKDYDIYIVMGMLKTKDINTCLKLLASNDIQSFFAVNLPADFDSYDNKEIVDIAKKQGITNTAIANTVKEAVIAISKLNNSTNKPKLIIICGSLYLLGEVLKDNSLLPD
ncbi:bifunctional folylpolyglutamate synthase/dihydrofolate synthase [Rickettsiales bacterium LUAb2]